MGDGNSWRPLAPSFDRVSGHWCSLHMPYPISYLLYSIYHFLSTKTQVPNTNSLSPKLLVVGFGEELFGFAGFSLVIHHVELYWGAVKIGGLPQVLF